MINHQVFHTKEQNRVLFAERLSTISIIIRGVRSSSTARVKRIFRSTTMPVLENPARVRSIHSASIFSPYRLQEENMAFAIPDSGITRISTSNRNASFCPQFHRRSPTLVSSTEYPRLPVIRCSIINSNGGKTLRTCKNCKTQFDPSLNHPRACRFHTAHFGGNQHPLSGH